MSDASVAPVSPVATGSSNTKSAAAASAVAAADYETFLALLVAQLQNQDPLEPTSETEFVAQLASFSNVEANTKTNEMLASVLTEINLAQAASFVGKTITTATGESGTVSEVRVTDSGLFATLSGGEVVALGAGTTIAQ